VGRGDLEKQRELANTWQCADACVFVVKTARGLDNNKDPQTKLNRYATSQLKKLDAKGSPRLKQLVPACFKTRMETLVSSS
jgi:hypothetical protein